MHILPLVIGLTCILFGIFLLFANPLFAPILLILGGLNLRNYKKLKNVRNKQENNKE